MGRLLAQPESARDAGPRLISLLGVVLAALVALTACTVARESGAEAPSLTPTVTIVPSPTGSTGLSVAGGTIDVTLTEFRIEMPARLQAGPTTFIVTNAGTVEHSFRIEGMGIDESLDTVLKPGETGTLLVELIPGTYEVSCPVGDHDERGMSLDLVVTE